MTNNYDVIIIGAGPGGIFAAYELMKQNKNTVYGKLHNFKDVKSVEDYQKIVPYSAYPDYEEYIDKMANKGEKNLITKRAIPRYAESSGSTGIYYTLNKNICQVPHCVHGVNICIGLRRRPLRSIGILQKQ